MAATPASRLPVAAVRVFEADRSGGFIVDLDELRRSDAISREFWAAPEQAVPA